MRATALRTGVTSGAFAGAPGYPHAVVDGFLPTPAFEAVAREFPGPDDLDERAWTSAYAKAVSGDLAAFGPATVALVEALQSQPWLDHLVEITGIPGLLADPACAPHLAHATTTGGYTRIHRDSVGHPECPMFRRVALILYVHEHWDESWGGDFQIWDHRRRTCLERIAPLPNRAILFATSPRSWHGFPDPLACPEGASRRALTLWYWTADRPTGLGWRRDDASATFRRRHRSDDPTNWSMRQRSLRQIAVPPRLRRLLRRALRRTA